MVLYLVLRLVELWWVERKLSGTKLLGQKIIPLLLVTAVILAFWGIPLLYDAYLALFIAFGFVASLPLFLIRHLPKLAQKIVGKRPVSTCRIWRKCIHSLKASHYICLHQ